MTPTQLAALKEEIQADPTGKGYGTFLPSAQGHVVDLLNAQTETMIADISAAVALTWAASGPMAAIVDASVNASHPCRASCLALLHAFYGDLPIQLGHPAVRGMFDGWEAVGLVTATQHQSLLDMAMQPASRAQVLGLGAVTGIDLAGAMQ